MTDHEPRMFTSDAEIEHLGEGLIARSLAREEWTHEAHVAATTYLLVKRPDVDVDARLPGLIRAFNESVGGVNNDHDGYHETITRAFLHGARLFLAKADREKPLHELANELLLSPMGRRDWPLRFFTAERLFSVEARRGWVAPDLMAMPKTNVRNGWKADIASRICYGALSNPCQGVTTAGEEWWRRRGASSQALTQSWPGLRW